MRKYMQGVTLMELMIVVVILGILTAVAYPILEAAGQLRNRLRATETTEFTS